jgi:hypothetical protein
MFFPSKFHTHTKLATSLPVRINIIQSDGCFHFRSIFPYSCQEGMGE